MGLNISIVTVSDLPEGLGNTTRLKTLVDVLVRLGHQVTVWNEHGLGVVDESFQKPMGQIQGAAYEYVLGKTARGKGFASIGEKIRAVREIQKRIVDAQARGRLDLVWFNNLSFYDIYPLTRVCNRLKIPTIQSYEDERRELVSTQGVRLAQRVYALNSWMADRCCARLADGIVVISNYLKKKYSALNRSPDRVHLVPTIIDCEKWKCAEEKDTATPIILYSGAFGEQDELANLVEALAVLRSRGYAFRMVMLGEDRREPTRKLAVRDQIMRLNLESIVQLKGFVPIEEVRRYVCESNILVNIRRDSAWSQSGLSTKLSEYLASGRMTVVSDVGDVSCYVRDKESAVLLPPSAGVSDIVEAISQGLCSYEFRRRTGRGGMNAAKRFFDMAVAERTVSRLLADVLRA